jgi:hypothetical protein
MSDRLIRLALTALTVVLLVRLGPAMARLLTGLGRSLAGLLALTGSGLVFVISLLGLCLFFIRPALRARSKKQ